MMIADRIRLKALLTPAYRRELTFCESVEISTIKQYGIAATDNQIEHIRNIFSAVRQRLRIKGGIK